MRRRRRPPAPRCGGSLDCHCERSEAISKPWRAIASACYRTPRNDGLTGVFDMDAAELRAMQAPIKERYKADPKAAVITLKAKGTLDDANIACKVETGRGLAVAGLHPATGGSGLRVG